MLDKAPDFNEVDPLIAIHGNKFAQSQMSPGEFEERERLITVPEGADGGSTVLVHGITDPKWNLKSHWEAWTPWMTSMGFASDGGFRCYRYDVENDTSPIFTRHGIEDEAMRLLEAVTQWRERSIDEEASWMKKRVAFVALDIGGIILKKAMSIASLDPMKYGNLHLNVTWMMFIDCPHRACDIEQMEDNITDLLSLRQPRLSNFIRKVGHVAKAASDANRSFLETKMLITTLVGNILSNGLGEEPAPEVPTSVNENEDDDESQFGDCSQKATSEPEVSGKEDLWDNPQRLCFIFDVPFERVYTSEIRHRKLVQGSSDEDERILSTTSLYVEKLSLSVEDAKTSTFDEELLADIHEWIVSQAPPIYPPTPLPIPPQTELISQSEPYDRWSHQEVFHVLHVHAPSAVSKISRHLVQHLNSYERRTGDKAKHSPGDVVYFEFNNKDATEKQMKSMLAYFIATIVSRFPSLADQLLRIHHQRSWALEDLMLTFHIMQACLNDRLICFAVGRLDLCDDAILRLFLKDMDLATAGQWKRPIFILTTRSDKESMLNLPSSWVDLDVQKLDFELSGMNYTDPQRDSIDFGDLPAKEYGAVSYISHAQRALSIAELSIFLNLHILNLDTGEEGKLMDENEISQLVNGMKGMIDQTMLFQTDRLQLCPTYNIESSAAFHNKVVLNLLSYLRRPAFQIRMLFLARRHQGLFKGPISPFHSDLITYAVMYWPVHFQLSGEHKPVKAVCEFLTDRECVIPWSEAFRTLSNPITRLNRCYLSPIPLTAMLGLQDVLSSLLENVKDRKELQRHCQPALVEAVQHGHIAIAQKLLGMVKMDNSTLADALVAAASFGPGGLLFELATLAAQRNEFQWPAELLCRTAIMGDHKTARVLLDAGMPVNPVDVFQNRQPLHLAAIHNRCEMASLLLQRNADIKSKAPYGRTALAVASYAQGSRELINLLIAAGSEVDAKDDSGSTPAQLAIVDGNLPAAEELFKAGANIEVGRVDEDSPGWELKPLTYCTQYPHLEGVELLLKYSPEVDSCWKGLTPLWIAVRENNLPIVRLLLENGANPNHNPDGWDMTLLVAVDRCNVDLVRLLVDHGADIEQEDNSSSWRRTALSRVAGTSNTDTLKYLLQHQPPADVGHVGEDSQTPLYVAASEGLTENVRILLEAGSDPTVPTDGVMLPLYVACKSPSTIKVLLSHGCDIDATCSGRSVLHNAIIENQVDSVKMLLKQNPKPDIHRVMPGVTYLSDDADLTPLSVACAKNNAKSVRWLIEAGAITHHQTTQGKRPLDIAIECDATLVFEVLMEYRVSVDYSDEEGNTALHRVTGSTTRAMVRALVSAGASIVATNKKGVTPLQIAVERSNIPVVKFLLSRGVSPNQFGDKHHSLLHIACVNRNLVMLRLLVKSGANVLKADTREDAPRLLTAVLNNWNHSDSDPLPPLLSYLMEECNVDKNLRGGFGDLPLITACFFKFTAQVRYLLERGTDPNLKDGAGRRALHIAALHKNRQLLDLLREFGADTFYDGTPIIDNIGRTLVHFAAVGADWNVFRTVCDFYAEEELHKPDGQGWTPLFWALLSPTASIQIVQHLVDHGADLWIRASGLQSEWSPLKLARYIGLSDEIQALLVPKSLTRRIEPEGRVEKWIEEDHLSRRAQVTSRLCDSCGVSVRGIGYRCPTCRAEDLCFRCYMSRNLILTRHAELEWLENGPEYAESEDPPVQTDSQNAANESDNGSVHSDRGRIEMDSKGDDHEDESNDGSDSQSQRSSFEDVVSDSHVSSDSDEDDDSI